MNADLESASDVSNDQIRYHERGGSKTWERGRKKEQAVSRINGIHKIVHSYLTSTGAGKF